MIINGKEIAFKIQESLMNEVKQLKEKLINPSLTLVQVGEEKASLSYARSISKEAEILGIYVEHYKMPYETSQEDLLSAIRKLNERRDIHGIIIEFPLPPNINKNIALEAINPDKDVDGFHPVNMGRLLEGTANFIPATAQSVIETIKSVLPIIEGEHAVVIGRSNIVGKPTALLLLKENATVTICHSRTSNLQSISQLADILVVSTGRPHMIDRSYVKRGAIVIDVGINKVNGKIIGDVNFDDVKDIAGWITPVPGGIGILTTQMLLKNTIKAAKIQNRIEL
jgi:methylenetetrahydrofolate dehydrogenase (NADP+)/methenyltetrahydrofolate cyclohydrolase